jgi:raffinose/stachyose/melibiose transport system substrate-binding protein
MPGRPRPLSRRGFLSLTGGLAAGATGLLSACGTAAGNSQELQLWSAFPSADVQDYFTKNFLDVYNTTATRKVQLSVKPGAAIDRLLQTALSAGGGPDFIGSSGPTQALTYVNAGKTAVLDPFIDVYGWDEKLLPWALKPGRVNGKLYSLPMQNETMAMYYNPATFEKHGWQPPTDLAEFDALCADAKSKGIMPLAAGNANWKAATEWYLSVFLNHAAGPEAVYQALTGKLPWTDAVFVDAVTLMRDQFKKGWWGGSVPDYFTNQFVDLYGKLVDGSAAMMISGTWTFADLPGYFGEGAGNDATWEWAVLPQMSAHAPAEVWDLSVGGTYSINAACDYLPAAADFLNFLVSDPKRQLAALADVALEPPPLHITDADYAPTTDPRVKRLFEQFQAADLCGYTTWTFWPPQSETYAYEEMEKVVTGMTTPKSYCSGLQELFAKELAAGGVPAVPPPDGAL